MLMERACGCKSRVRGGRRRAVARHEHGARAAAAALELGARARHDECRRCAPGRAAAPELVIAGVVKVRAEQAELAARRAVAQARHDTGALERRVARQGEIVHREQPQPVALRLLRLPLLMQDTTALLLHSGVDSMALILPSPILYTTRVWVRV